MKLQFIDHETEDSHIVFLGKLSFRYCNNFDGFLYTTFSTEEKNSQKIVKMLIDRLVPYIVCRKNAIILNLLVDPFFDELCTYLSAKPKIKKGKLYLIKKHIFKYLGNDFEHQCVLKAEGLLEGSEIYFQKKMHEKSKKMLEML